MQTLTLSRKKRLGFWLLGIVLGGVLLSAVSLFVADRLLTSPRAKAYIQQILVAHTGLQVGYEKVGIGYFPSLHLELHQLTCSIPDILTGKADLLRLSPAILDLLTGKLNLGKVELVRPDITLTLAQSAENSRETNVPPASEENRNGALASFFSVVPALHAIITDGRFSVAFGAQSYSGEHLTLSLDGAVENTRSGKVAVQMELAEFAARLGERRAKINGVKLRGSIRADDGDITCQLDQLSLTKPALNLSGNLTMAQAAGAIALSLAGANIDVDATRATALALAGDVSPITEIFTYLAGGTVPRITFTSRGKSFSELGDLKSIRIEGHLQNGAVAIPEIDMRLAEVIGDVVIADGVLTGTGLSARLAGSAGHSGLLRLGLAEDNDLFQLELMLNADLSQAQRIIKHIAPKTKFSREIERITNLKGTGSGKLILGDSLGDIKVGLENADVTLSGDYQRVPYPISITKGRVNVTKDRVAVSGVNANVGKSHVAGLAAAVDWGKGVHLAIDAERAGVSVDELYSYLNSVKEVQTVLKEIKEASGGLELSAATFSGDIGAPQQWKYAAQGSINGLNLKVSAFPGSIKLAKGNFSFDRSQLNAQGVVGEVLDANLALRGTIGDYSAISGMKADVTIDGTMGKDSVLWLQETFKVPKAYAIRAPLTLKGVRVSGKPKQALSVSGNVAVKDGPQVTLDMQYQPEELKGDKLTVKDQYSEAGMTFVSKNDGLEVSFAGRLSSETLAGLFVDPKWGKGHVEGDVLVSLPKKTKTRATAKGHLKGTNIVIPLGSDDDVSIGQVVLEANGSTAKADASALSWRDFTWNPLAATIAFEPDKLTVKVGQAALCGIDSPGSFVVSGKDVDLDVALQGKNLDVGTSYSCLTQGRVKMTGTMEFSSHIKAKGEMGEIIGRLEGPLKMTFRQGVIEQNRILSTLLEVLNVTEIVKGRLPNMATTGFKYSIITVDGQFRNGKLVVEKLFVDGETLEILGFGEVDLEKETVNLELLAAPFKTVDTIIKYVPGVNYLMGDSLVVVPVNVNGALTDPKVHIMSPTSVSKGLLNLGSRVLKLPYKLMESIITGGREAEKAVF